MCQKRIKEINVFFKDDNTFLFRLKHKNKNKKAQHKKSNTIDIYIYINYKNVKKSKLIGKNKNIE